MEEQYIAEMLNIKKAFGGIQALDDVTLKIKKGEVHALVGENGAGKSTLMNVLSGSIRKDAGKIIIEGKKEDYTNTHDAKLAGIGIIHQEFALVPDLTVYENICLGNELSGSNVFMNKRIMRDRTINLLEEVGFDIKPNEKVQDLSVAYQQMTEIAKVVGQHTKVIIFDEPTAVLAPAEAQKLFEVIKRLKEKGISIIYISHRLEEIFEISDRVTVLKDGKFNGTVITKETNMEQVINMMIGRDLSEMYPKKVERSGEIVFEAKNLNRGKIVKDVSFNVREGEILGFAGLVGAGKTEIMRLIFGADKRDSGQLFLDDKRIRVKSPKQAVSKGISYVPENRKDHGIHLKLPVSTNVTMPSLSDFTGPVGWLKKRKETIRTQEMIDGLDIKVEKPSSLVGELSGGNQQKVSLAKWIQKKNRLIILDEPTRGVDVGAKVEIYKIVRRLADEGMAIIFISSEMLEIIGMCNRVIVINEGRIAGELGSDEISEENIIALAVGQKEKVRKG